jgi:G protein beta subunit-like protein
MSMKKRQASGNVASGSSTDPVILATAGYDHQIRFWQAHSGVCHRTVQHQDSQVNDMEITPDRQMLAVAGYQHIRMFDLAGHNSNPLVNYDGIQRNVTVVGFQEDGKWMFTGGEDNSARIWDLRSRNLQCQRIFQVNSPVNTIVLHPNQAELFIGDQSGIIHIWDLKTDNNVQEIPEPDAMIQSVSIDPDGTLMAAVNNKGNCYVYSLARGRRGDDDPTKSILKHNFSAHSKYALKCQFSPDSTLLATTSADGTAKIWKTADWSLMTELKVKMPELKNKSDHWVWDCAFSADSQYIITASSDGNARLWSIETGEVKREYSGHQKAVICLAFRDEVPTG